MSARARRALWLLLCAAFFAALAYAYRRHVWSAPPGAFVWLRAGVRYELLQPRMLGVGLLAPWFVAVLAWSLADLPWQQRTLAVALRIAFAGLLGVALARPVRSASTDKLALVVLVDVSDSVSDEALADARKLLDEAWSARRKDDVVRLVTFAERPRLIEVFDADGRPVVPPVERHRAVEGGGDTVKGDVGAGSNLQAALQLSYGLFPPGHLRRALLISDGLETDGDLLAEANRALEHGVKLHTSPYRREPPAEVAVRELVLPERVKVGETFEVKADVYATRTTRAKVKLHQGETLNGLDGVREVELTPGPNPIVFKSVVRVPGEVTYAFELSEIGADRFAENNRIATTIDVPGRPQVLYVDDTPQHSGPLARALTAQQYDVDVRPPTGFPASLKELERYDFVVLSDVAKERFSVSSQGLVESYVRDLGGGFLYAGGENGYALGGWQDTTLARLLPVRMDSERMNRMPSVAMVLVVDHSGSMTGLPMEMAKKAAKATLDVLAGDDVVSVVVFDSTPETVVKMQPVRNRNRIRGLISQVQPAGGTEIFPALDRAYGILSVTEARKKHVILLTDGKSPSGGIRELVSQMIAESITVTSVGLGGEVDEALLKTIADVGGGRYHEAPDPNSLPRIFTKETEMIAKAAAVEDWFPVAQTDNASFLKRIDVRSAPFLHGYVATKLKPPPAVQLLANGDTDEPILARWRVGTGWALAWTSDVKARWATEWIGWPGWEKFWGQLVREHMRHKERHELDMQTEVRGGVLHATVDAFTADERFDNQLASALTVTGPLPGNDKRVVPMRQTAPGRYEASLPLERHGSFLLRAEHGREQPDGTRVPVASSRAHVSYPYPREYAAFRVDDVVLERAALAGAGRFSPDAMAPIFEPEGEKLTYHEELWARAVMAAIVAFVLDLALRRVRLFDRGFKGTRPDRSARRWA
ncbi:MAG: VWA domain-containing protein [Deltaproteobacteria bacterium]|nr:VWA domain-containing protein [Deltaproteobacteria bacterium]